jgi:hypothetical protein
MGINWEVLIGGLVQELLVGVLTALAGAATAYVIGLAKHAWANAHNVIGTEWSWALDEAASMAVRAAEQIGLKDKAFEKKEWAVAKAQEILNARGIKVNLSILDAAIEAAVLSEINRQSS